jgi:hypothetical protein
METTFDLQKVIEGAVVRCREPYFTPVIERQASRHSLWALVGRVSCEKGSMTICWKSDGGAVRQSSSLFDDHADSDFDLLMVGDRDAKEIL